MVGLHAPESGRCVAEIGAAGVDFRRPEKRNPEADSRCFPPPDGGFIISSYDLFLEIAVVQTFETFTVTGFVLSHFVNGVMDSVEVQCFGTGSDTLLVFACT